MALMWFQTVRPLFRRWYICVLKMLCVFFFLCNIVGVKPDLDRILADFVRFTQITSSELEQGLLFMFSSSFTLFLCVSLQEPVKGWKKPLQSRRPCLNTLRNRLQDMIFYFQRMLGSVVHIFILIFICHNDYKPSEVLK